MPLQSPFKDHRLLSVAERDLITVESRYSHINLANSPVGCRIKMPCPQLPVWYEKMALLELVLVFEHN